MERFFYFEVLSSLEGLNCTRFRLPRDRKVLIGRCEEADIWLPCTCISRRHAEVEVVGEVARVRDLDSRNGSGVGLLLQRGFTAVLQPEDVLSLPMMVELELKVGGTPPPSWLQWNDGTVLKIAKSIYYASFPETAMVSDPREDACRFADLPILADALEDAGCADAAILEHCRAGGEHVRGCWVVDLLLGKS